jgi:branched-chain amino acid transport system ATP-binding protein
MNDIMMKFGTEEYLEVTDVSVAYGKIPAVRNVSLKVDPGEVVLLVGPNSAGKSSLLNAIATRSRWMTVTGHVSIGGQRIEGIPTDRRWSAGLRLVPQGRQIFPSLDVEENLRVIADNLGIPWEEAIEKARHLFPQIFLKRTGTPAGNLSGGEQQMLALSRALIGKPRVLLLDEPGLGLASIVIRELVRVVRDLSGQGMAILVAEQGVEAWGTTMHRAHVMIRGEIVGTTQDRHTVEGLLGLRSRYDVTEGCH